MCKITGCEKKVLARGLCSTHYSRWRLGQSLDTPVVSRPPEMSLEERFWSKVDKKGNDECWLWTSTVNARGYGCITVAPYHQYIRAHRLSWKIATGYDAGSLDVLHRCDVPLCVNPNHLFLGTAADNIADKVAKGRQAKGAAINTHKDHAKWKEERKKARG